MLRNRFLRSLTDNCRNALKINAMSTTYYNNRVFPLFNVGCQSIFHSKRVFSNGFPEPAVMIRCDEFEKSKRHYSRVSRENCWKCKEELGIQKFICNACGSLQKPRDNINYFDLLGVTMSFDVNLEDLSIKFRNLQMAFHPDKFVNKSKVEQETSEIYSRLLNKAYATLKDPVARGFYLLEKEKFRVDPNHPMDPDFLVSVMEKNEELEKISTAQKLEKFLKSNNLEMEKYIYKVSEAFRQNDLPDARTQIMKLNYFVNMDFKVKKKIMELHEGTQH